MAHSAMTRWIEDADARQFSQAVMFDRRLGIAEAHYVHLGQTIARMPMWVRHNVSGRSLAAIGCQALAFIRHHEDRKIT